METLERKIKEENKNRTSHNGKINSGRNLYEIRLEERTEKVISNYLEKTKIFSKIKDEENLKNIILKNLKYSENKNWIPTKSIDIVRTPEEFMEVSNLRSKIYNSSGYGGEFEEKIGGLIFDEFDTNSLIFIYKREGEISGTIKLTTDDKNILPSETKCNFSNLRTKGKIAELGKQVVLPKFQSSGIEFKNFYCAAYTYATMNEIDFFIGGFKKEHAKLYEKFGGIKILSNMENYGNINLPFQIASWNLKEISPFFKRAFLRGFN